mgnify:CR=1 FL=1
MTYYPIGTVVVLKDGNRPIMIYGRRQKQLGTEKEWDYVACLYPEGNLGEDYNIFFQHEEIEFILHKGLINDSEKRMLKILQTA